MSPDRGSRLPPGDEPDDDFEEEGAPRSIFSAAWFRIVLVLLGVAVVGAVAVPYVLDVVNAPSDGPGTRTTVAPMPPTTPPAPTSPAPAPPAPSATKSAAPSEGPGARTSAAPAPAAKAPDKARVAEAPKPTPPSPAKKEPAAEAPKREPVAAAAAARPTTPTRVKSSEGGDYFVQVGAFGDQDAAKKLASRLRDQNYPVDESVKRVEGALAPAPRPAPRAAAAPSGPDRYDVIVSGGSAAEINSKLAAKGLASEPAGDSVRIRPSLPLRDAVALSKDLGSEGFKVQVRRGGSGGGVTPGPAPAATSGGETGGGQTLYRVRVGGYPDRAAALAVQKELQEKGYQPFIAKGRE